MKTLLVVMLIISVLANIYQQRKDPCEYQIVVTDNYVTVHDYDRYVGTIKLNGSLKRLINKDNE